jgi:hypothetical protein
MTTWSHKYKKSNIKEEGDKNNRKYNDERTKYAKNGAKKTIFYEILKFIILLRAYYNFKSNAIKINLNLFHCNKLYNQHDILKDS